MARTSYILNNLTDKLLNPEWECPLLSIMEHNQDKYEFAFDIANIKLLKGVVDYALEVWPGSPKRPEIEQEFLWHMREQLAKCIMEHSFYNLSIEDSDK